MLESTPPPVVAMVAIIRYDFEVVFSSKLNSVLLEVFLMLSCDFENTKNVVLLGMYLTDHST